MSRQATAADPPALPNAKNDPLLELMRTELLAFTFLKQDTKARFA